MSKSRRTLTIQSNMLKLIVVSLTYMLCRLNCSILNPKLVSNENEQSVLPTAAR